MQILMTRSELLYKTPQTPKKLTRKRYNAKKIIYVTQKQLIQRQKV